MKTVTYMEDLNKITSPNPYHHNPIQVARLTIHINCCYEPKRIGYSRVVYSHFTGPSHLLFATGQ